VDEPVLEPIPNARDLLGGHVVLAGALGAKWPFGSLNDQQTQRSELGPGLALNLDLGVGLSRTVVLGVWGEFDDYSAPPLCAACSAKSFAGGPFLRYHAVQGARFDPWAAFGVGVRQTNIDNGGQSSEHFFGAELLRLSLGADWYATSNIAIGPYVELDMGSYGRFDLGTLHTDLGTGLRLTLDFPGKSARASDARTPAKQSLAVVRATRWPCAVPNGRRKKARLCLLPLVRLSEAPAPIAPSA
jgi:hypothetical protein